MALNSVSARMKKGPKIIFENFFQLKEDTKLYLANCALCSEKIIFINRQNNLQFKYFQIARDDMVYLKKYPSLADRQ